jgi:HAD superfamily hydrolase (TIGR01459 family)
MFRIITSLNEITDDFDVFLIDLWGVLHDGVEPYPGAINALENLRKAGKTVILISNAPRRAYKVASVLNNLGFTSNLWDEIITSGEITYLALDAALGSRESPIEPPLHLKKGDKYYYIGPDKDADILEGLGLVRIEDAKSASFALVTGFDNFGDMFSAKEPQARAALEAGIPLICANPDKLVVRQTGEEMLCAGLIGEWYIKNSGKTVYYGKPYYDIYEMAKRNARKYTSRQNLRFCGIGDGLFTDIQGAVDNGISSIFISGGIHAAELGISEGQPTHQILHGYFDNAGFQPNFVLHRFVW